MPTESLAAIAAKKLEEIEAAGLRRRLKSVESSQGPTVKLGGREVQNFSSNDYLGLAASPALKAAMIAGVERFGTGSGASRLVCGNFSIHSSLEKVLAHFKGTEAALSFSSGYATAMGVVPALCGKDDIILLDKLAHASLIDAAKLSGATLRVFPHNHLEKLQRLLAGTHQARKPGSQVLILTESIFSMDGDAAPLQDIADLAERYEAQLLVDEAHAVGVTGPQGRGLVAALGLERRVPLQMGTMSKALGLSGGYIAAQQSVVDLLLNRARSLIYSTAPPPALAYAAGHALEIVSSEGGDALRQMLANHKKTLSEALGAPEILNLPGAIIPLMVGDERAATEASAALLERGFLIPAIRFPTVARGKARLRLTLSAAHSAGQIQALGEALARTGLLPQR